MEERQDQTEDEVQLPDERVEDLDPSESESDDVSGGRASWDMKANKKV
jgi:hypothetical protein